MTSLILSNREFGAHSFKPIFFETIIVSSQQHINSKPPGLQPGQEDTGEENIPIKRNRRLEG
jgi:hypothetical protein